jgi:glutathione synthase/RimK-type ligase-like ATP-grasp enzyme
MPDELNKLQQLQIADKIGLNIPHTFLKTHLNKQDFSSHLITKPMSDGIGLSIGNAYYKTYTSEVSQDICNKSFLISLFQQKIEKEIELRVFFLEKKCHTIAILSQSDPQTAIDYRNYNHSHFNRLEHYALPRDVSQKIELFMEHFNLQTGSLDFIIDKQGKHIFLEVNPSGQYGIFNACNIYPDKLIAEYLLKKHYEHH